jgi:hypothetical protein
MVFSIPSPQIIVQLSQVFLDSKQIWAKEKNIEGLNIPFGTIMNLATRVTSALAGLQRGLPPATSGIHLSCQELVNLPFPNSPNKTQL